RLRYLDDVMPRNVTTLFSDRHNILDSLSRADLLIGAVLIPGAKAPFLVRREDLKRMQRRAVIIDVAIDQGGCVETSQPTTHSKPTYIVDEVVHYCVTNMPGAVGRTSTYALTNVTLPYVMQLAKKGYARAVKENAALAHGVNIRQGKVTNLAVAETCGMRCVAVIEYPPTTFCVSAGASRWVLFNVNPSVAQPFRRSHVGVAVPPRTAFFREFLFASLRAPPYDPFAQGQGA